jgi:hypothetical protein
MARDRATPIAESAKAALAQCPLSADFARIRMSPWMFACSFSMAISCSVHEKFAGRGPKQCPRSRLSYLQPGELGVRSSTKSCHSVFGRTDTGPGFIVSRPYGSAPGAGLRLEFNEETNHATQQITVGTGAASEAVTLWHSARQRSAFSEDVLSFCLGCTKNSCCNEIQPGSVKRVVQ